MINHNITSPPSESLASPTQLGASLSPGLTAPAGFARALLWTAGATALLIPAYGRFFAGTFFSQDGFVWLCFSKFHPMPLDVLWRDTLCGQFFRPVGQLWWVLIHSLAGESVLAYQIAFLAVHIGNAALAGLFARAVVGPGVGRIVFVLFSLNPIFVAPISYHYHYNFDTAGLTFYLLSLLFLWRSVRRRSWPAGLLSLIAALASYFSKEAYVTLPAAVLLVLGIKHSGSRWRMETLWERRRWFLLHAALWAGAVAWRTAVIRGVGGYGLADISDASSLLDHAFGRLQAFLGFAGWSLSPNLERWTGTEFWPLAISGVVLASLTWIHTRCRTGPGVMWVWSWMLLAWTPSMLMVTYAAVSWYPCLLGSVLLLAVPLSRARWTPVCLVLLGTWYALHGYWSYTGREAYIAVLRSQRRELRRHFPEGGWTLQPGQRVVLLRSNPDLFPDAIVKYQTPLRRTVADVLFLNPQTPVDWVITNRPGPGDIWPMSIAPAYQTGFMEMREKRVYPLTYQEPWQRSAMLRRSPPFRFLAWHDGRLIDVSPRAMAGGSIQASRPGRHHAPTQAPSADP